MSGLEIGSVASVKLTIFAIDYYASSANRLLMLAESFTQRGCGIVLRVMSRLHVQPPFPPICFAVADYAWQRKTNVEDVCLQKKTSIYILGINWTLVLISGFRVLIHAVLFFHRPVDNSLNGQFKGKWNCHACGQLNPCT
jgi:hypothetical protein